MSTQANPPPPDAMLTQAAVARALDMAPKTLMERVHAGIVKPDSIAGSPQRPIRLFRASRLAAIRTAIRGERIVA